MGEGEGRARGARSYLRHRPAVTRRREMSRDEKSAECSLWWMDCWCVCVCDAAGSKAHTYLYKESESKQQQVKKSIWKLYRRREREREGCPGRMCLATWSVVRLAPFWRPPLAPSPILANNACTGPPTRRRRRWRRTRTATAQNSY